MPYHLPIIGVQLTRHLDVLFDDVKDEVVCSFSDCVQLNKEGEYDICILLY